MEELLAEVVGVLVTVVEACGAAVILAGAVWAFARFVWVGVRGGGSRAFVPVRLTLGRFLALGLEFQLASDVLRTAVALGVLLDLLLAAGLLRLAAEPTWASLATAAAVVLLRRLIGAGLRAGGRAFSAAVVARPARDRRPPRP